MKSTPSRSWPSVAFFAALAVAWAVFAARMFSVEPELAVVRARDRLAALAGHGSFEVANAALAALADEAAPQCRIRAGRFVSPKEAIRADRLDFVVGRDAAGEFYLRAAERAEREGDVQRSIGLLRVASALDRDPELAMVALSRIPALLRRADNADHVDEAVRVAVARLGPLERRSREGLLLRTQAASAGVASSRSAERVAFEDVSLVDDLCALLGGEDAAIARGLLSTLGLMDSPEPDDPRIVRRQEELARMSRARALIARSRASPRPTIDPIRVGELLVLAKKEVDDLVVVETAIPKLADGVSFGDLSLDWRWLVERAPALNDYVIARALIAPIRDEGRLRAVRGSAASALLAIFLAIAWRQTRRAWARERAASEARAEFLERIGHDLRTPLSLIRMYAETLESGRVKDPQEAREFAGIAAREAARLSGVVEDVMDLSRVQSSFHRLKNVDLARLAETVVQDQAGLFREQGRSVQLELPKRAVFVSADPDALRGAVGNLLENAWRHGAGEVRVLLAASARSATLSVSDQGEGLAPGEEQRVFDRFARGANARGKGGGLGLALVREVCERSGGSAWYAATDPLGKAFVMELPTIDPTKVENAPIGVDA